MLKGVFRQRYEEQNQRCNPRATIQKILTHHPYLADVLEQDVSIGGHSD
jgi:hypothetical protein